MHTRKITSEIYIKKIKIVLGLTLSYFFIQIIGGIVSGSLSLIADSGHMLVDVAGLTMSLISIKLTLRPPTPKRTFGLYRLEILAALGNSILLILISFYIFIESYQRIVNPQEIDGILMSIIAAIGLVINLIGMKIISGSHHHDGDNLNIEGAKLEILSDILGSISVLVGGLIIILTGFYLLDILISIGLSLLILPRVYTLLKRSIHVLIEGTPLHISYEEIKKSILNVKGVTGIFDIHIWTITSGIYAFSAHVVILDIKKSQSIIKEITSILENKFGIKHSTIQLENYHPDNSDL